MLINTYLISTYYEVKGGFKSGVDSGIYFRGAPFIGEVCGDRLGPKRVKGSAQYGAPGRVFLKLLGIRNLRSR